MTGTATPVNSQEQRLGRRSTEGLWLQHGRVGQVAQHAGLETTAAGPFDNWPTGLGFEYFYGFLSGEASQ